MSEFKVLIVDDERSIRKTLGRALANAGYQVGTAEDGASCMQALSADFFDAILLDIRLPDADGLEILSAILSKGLPSKVIMITAHGTIDSAVEAVKSGAHHYITKPLDIDNLKHILKELKEKKLLRKENETLRGFLKDDKSDYGIVGQSPKILEAINIVGIAASSDENVLITGETGTGKELFADAIHFHSKRKNFNWMKINCAAIPESMLESELFGHVKGAFTGAGTMKKGIFEHSDKGSLLLDEIGCMKTEMQAKLLRVIEEKKVRRIGADSFVDIDTRLIASTNEKLDKAIRDGAFREDLYFRLNVINIHIPPLRERTEDIPLLLDFFIDRETKKNPTSAPVSFSDEALDAVVKYPWPGNVRELSNFATRMFLFHGGASIDRDKLPEIMVNPDVRNDEINNNTSGIKSVDARKVEAVTEALQKSGGNKSAAARLLNVSRDYIRKYSTGYGLK